MSPGGKKGKKGAVNGKKAEESDIFKLVKMIMQRNFDPVRIATAPVFLLESVNDNAINYAATPLQADVLTAAACPVTPQRPCNGPFSSSMQPLSFMLAESNLLLSNQ